MANKGSISDENDCQVMRLQKGYNKKYSPEKNTTVLIDVEVKDIKLINELEQVPVKYHNLLFYK